ncbi:MAG: hypothetical protein Fur0034_06990 [Desulfuromonadia bacterium]
MTDDDRSLLREEVTRFGVDLTENHLAAFDILVDELIRWNRSINLTAIHNPREIVVKHLIDSLSVTPFTKGAQTILDIGSGAGFPSLPLAITHRGVAIHSVESSAKKGAFQKQIVRLLSLPHVTVHTSRIEAIPPGRIPLADLVLSRAFRSLREFIPISIPFLAPGGIILAMKGKGWSEEIREAQKIMDAWRVGIWDEQSVNLPFGMGMRVIIALKRSDQLQSP